MTFIFVFAALILALLLFRLRIKAGFSIRNLNAEAAAVLFIFGLIPVKLRTRLELVLCGGIKLSVNGAEPKPIREFTKKKKRLPPAVLLRSIRVKRLDFSGRVGIKDHPDKSVLIAGSLASLFTQASAALAEAPVPAEIKPEFGQGVFALNVEGIMSVAPGKLLVEIIKNKRRRK